MATAKGKVQISGRFSPGTTVELHERGSADVYAGGTGGKVTQAKTDKDGVTTFEAPPGNYFAIAKQKEWDHVLEEHTDRVRAVDVTIRQPQPQQVAPEVLPSGPEPPSPSFLDHAEIVVGARSSVDGDATVDRTMLRNTRTGAISEFAGPVGHQIPKKDQPADGVPQPRQEDHRKEELASSTLTGEAVPPMEQPRRQDEVPDKEPQASSTEEGYEAPAREPIRQEDVPKGTRQASATETGEAHVVGDPSNPRTSPTKDVPDTFKGKGGSSQPKQATRKAKGRSGAKSTGKKAAAHQRKANESKQVKAAKKASGGRRDVERSRADTSARSQPATDARGVEHVEVPETIGSPEDK